MPQPPKRGPKKPSQKPKIRLPKGDGPKKPNFWSQLLIALLVFVTLISLYSHFSGQGDVEEIPLSELATEIQEGNVDEIVVKGDTVEVTLTDESQVKTRKETGASLSETLSNYGVILSEYPNITLSVQDPSGLGYWLIQLAPFLVPVLLILFFIWILTRQMKGSGMQAFSFGQSRARMIDPTDESRKITFDDVAGVKEAKEELKEIVDFLQNPKKYINIGAEIPKGVMLMGAPGVGKTLLARAVAGEADVPFFSISGSEFVEMFVGVGASRVRDTFQIAKKNAPAIIFIDEIDAVGRTRGVGVGGGNDEREQTLNQILVELDGFEPNEQVIVMAATNRPDVLDPALLRPGRFDRRVRIDLPDIDDREKILEVHARKKPLEDDVTLRTVAERTPGFSGADLQSLMNEAAILAARDDRKKVAQRDLTASIEKVMLGPERRSHLLSDDEKKITAYHEAGHALVASMLPYAHPVHKISIISRGHAAGYTLHLPTEERRFQSRKEFKDTMAVMLGGYVTELEVFGDLTTGPSNDLERITERARDMVTKYGMSENIGPIALETDTGKALYGKASGDRDYSEKISSLIDNEISRIIEEAREKAHTIITEKRDVLDELAEKLLEKETMERKEFESFLRGHGIEVKDELKED
ncbi:MAG: ATP-dependent zinc metalloprotease FtsH [Candidatus Paceibacterota bacterium]